jgi:hypothetical protein
MSCTTVQQISINSACLPVLFSRRTLQTMQISRRLKQSKLGSLHYRQRLFSVIVLTLILVVIFLAAFINGPQNIVTPPQDNTNPNSGSQGGSSSFGGIGAADDVEPSTPPTPTPEYGFSGGGIIALVICFAAFALFAQRKKIFDKKAPAERPQGF